GPAADPASVPSTMVGKTLLVPVEIGISGTGPLAPATRRLVPSPPRVIRQLTPASTIHLVACDVSALLNVTGISSTDTCKPFNRTPSRARAPIPNESGRIHPPSTPTASNPTRT